MTVIRKLNDRHFQVAYFTITLRPDSGQCSQKIQPIPLIIFIHLNDCTMSTLKVIELMANSPKSWEDATQQAVAEASKSIQHIRSVYVKDHSVLVEKNKIVEYRATLKLCFEIEHKTNNNHKERKINKK